MAVSNDRSAYDSRRAWITLGMTVIFMMINFADKAVIGLAAPHIIKELHLTNEQFGQIGSAFFLLFSITAALVGFLVNRVSTKIVLTVMALIWALTQMPMLGLVSVQTLVVSRIILGAGEGPAFPVALHAVYKWFPNDRWAIPTSLVSIGAPIGLSIFPPLLTWIIVSYSWHAAFGFLGLVGFAWAAIWMLVGKEGPFDARQAEAGTAILEHVPYSTLLTSRTFLGVTLASFASYWAVALAVVWLPSFLIKVVGYSPIATGWIVSLPSMLQVVLSPSMGFISQKLRSRGFSSRVSRGLFTGGGVIIVGAAMMVLSKSSGEFEPALAAMVAFAFCGVSFAIGPTLIGEISPVRQRGAMLGISNGLFTTAGLAAPWLMGHLVDVGVDPAQGFRDGFMYASWFIVGGGIVAIALIHPKSDLVRFRRSRDVIEDNGLSALQP